MKTNTLDKYERERRWVKGVFWITLLSHGYIYYLLPYLGYNFCDWSTSNKWWCNFSLYQNSYFFSCYIVLFIPIFFINSKNFKSWVKIPIIFSILGAIDIFLRKDSSQLDFFMIGPGPTIIYIYIIGFVWSLVIAFRNRK